ncbi:hypothetical protein [Vulcanisaeta sp. JCM 16161]|uniref:hypothetical protein n=1 Tax=Vulcanisaeta sp. JCM 16161 TaxID=1295372 RepID=UPI0006D06E36|nr:hypothetical protein [Vulcanisaeta sp. JCM 16161]
MEKLNVRKCVMISVGLYPGNARQALARAGPVGGDVVFLVNSEPREVPREALRGRWKQPPVEAMEALHKFVNELDSGIEVVDVWLDLGMGLRVVWLGLGRWLRITRRVGSSLVWLVGLGG